MDQEMIILSEVGTTNIIYHLHMESKKKEETVKFMDTESRTVV